MKITILLAASGLLATVAHAQPSSPTATPPAVQSVRLSLSVKSAGAVRTHDLVISDRGCGIVKEKTAAYEDDIRVCSVPTATGLSLELEGMTRAGTSEYRQRSEIVVARKGASIEVGRAGGMRFAIKTL